MLVAKSREHDFAKKCPNFFSNFIGPVTSTWVLSFPKNHAYGLNGTSISQKNVCDVKKSACMATGGRKIPVAGFSKEGVNFLKFHEPVAPLWLL